MLHVTVKGTNKKGQIIQLHLKRARRTIFFGNFIPTFNNIYFIFQIIKQENVISYRVIILKKSMGINFVHV